MKHYFLFLIFAGSALFFFTRPPESEGWLALLHLCFALINTANAADELAEIVARKVRLRSAEDES